MRRRGVVLGVLVLVAVVPGPWHTEAAAGEPLAIEGDAALAAWVADNGWTGDGSAAAPYLVTALTSPGLSLQHTRAHVTFKDCVFERSATGGVLLHDAHNVTLRNATFTWPTGEARTGIAASAVRGLTIADSLFQGGAALRVSDGTDVRVLGNTFVADSRAGNEAVTLTGVVKAVVADNHITDWDHAGAEPWAVSIDRGHDVIIRGNHLSGTGDWDAVRLRDADDITVDANVITGATHAVSATATSGIAAHGNRFTAVTHGIWAYGQANVPMGHQWRNNTIEAIGAGLVVEDSAPAVLAGNDVTSRSSVAISIRSDDVLVHDNRVASERWGLWGSGQGIQVRDNRLQGGLFGLELHEADGFEVAGNTLSSAGTAALVHESGAGTFRANVAAGGDTALLAVDVEDLRVTANDLSGGRLALALAGAARPLVLDNHIHNGSTGLRLQDTHGAELTGNRISGNGVGIMFVRAADNQVSRNHLVENEFGITLQRSGHNLVYDNAFANARNVHFEDAAPNPASTALLGTVPDNPAWAFGADTNAWSVEPVAGTNIAGGPTIAGNLWSDYGGKDVTGDGLGELPHGLLPWGSPAGEALHTVAPQLAYGPWDRHPLVDTATGE